ncbi:MAG: sulfite exporter TauE/SafE family protein [Verrucomicrobia bacterium]|nr:sulfite exporter TauE/SafE family protein [Verrucomicrobiota bacterium]
MNFEIWQWAVAALAAVLVGVSKGGITGMGFLPVVIFAQVLPSTRESTGFVLPLLIFGDLVAVLNYRRHTQWSHLWKLFPWTAAGVLTGYFAMGRINDWQTAKLIGLIIVGLVILHVWRRRQEKLAGPGVELVHVWWFAPTIGVLAGFTTLVANAAGPLMAIYLLAMHLPKMEFVGTGAVFFMLLNWFKVPFMVNLGLITADSVKFNLFLAPAVLAGTFAGRWLLTRINQKWFENLALGLSALGAMRLLW